MQLFLFDFSKTNEPDFCVVKNELNPEGKINMEDKEYIDKTISEINSSCSTWYFFDLKMMWCQDVDLLKRTIESNNSLAND